MVRVTIDFTLFSSKWVITDYIKRIDFVWKLQTT